LSTEPTNQQPKRPLIKWPFSFAPSVLNPWRGLGGLPREAWLLSAANLVNRAGMMILPFLVLYLTRELGFSAGRAGFILALYGVTAIVAAPIAGRLCDTIGPLPVMRGSLLSSGLVLLLFPFARSFAAVAAVTIVWSACAEMFRPASLAAMTGVVPPAQRKAAFALNRLAINLGMSVGPALGGFLATVSFNWMFVVDAVTTIAAGAVLSLTAWRPDGAGAVNTKAAESGQAGTIFADRTFLVFLGGVLLVGIVFFQHEAALPLYLDRELRTSPAFYGMLFTINTILIVAFEVPLNMATAHWPNTRALVIGCMLFAFGFGSLALVASAAGVIWTVVIWTFGEMMLFPAMSAHMGDIAPENRRGAYMGAYTMALSVAFTLGPWAGVSLLATLGATVIWLVMFGLGALAAALMAYAAPRARILQPAAGGAGS